MMENKPYIYIGNKIYAMNLQKIADFCLVSDKLKNKESEVTEGYEVTDENGPELVSKVVREIKTNGNPQNDTIKYDLIRIFIDTVLAAEGMMPEMTTGMKIAFNTLVENGFLYEITD